MIHGSIFAGVRDKRPEPFSVTGFTELVSALSNEAVTCDPAAKAGQTCVSPATYVRGGTRSKAGAISWDWFAADIDNKSGNRPGSTIADITAVMDELAAPRFIYTTASSRSPAECFRLMFPLDRPILNGEFDEVWRAFSHLLPMDPATKDISRLFIAPRRWTERENQSEFVPEGSPVCVDQILRRFPIPVSHAVATNLPRAVVTPSHAPKKRNIANITRSALPSLDAPYVSRRAIEEAQTAACGGRMYRFLVAVAFGALRHGYDIDVRDLESIGRELASRLGRGTSDIRHDAQSAHRYAELHHSDQYEARRSRMRSAMLPRMFR